MNEDELLAASAAQAIKVGQQAEIDRTGDRDATTAGLAASNISDGVMNEGRSYAGGGGGGAPGDVQSRELAANQQTINARRVIEEVGGLDMSDLLAPDLNSGDATTRENARSLIRREQMAAQMANKMVNAGAQHMINDAYMNPNEASMLMEQDSYTPVSTNDGWGVVKKYAKLKGGKQIAVFVVEDSLSGMSTGKKYRISSIAEKVSRVLNATQNMDDARIKMIDRAYDQHVTIMRSLNEAKRSGNRQTVSVLESKLAAVNSKLGLS